MSRIVATADEFLTSPKLERPKEDVPVPELGEGVVIPVWGLNPAERTDFESRLQRPKSKGKYRQLWVIECCRNDDGTKIFSMSQVEKLGERSGIVMERLLDVALRLCGVTGQDLEKLTKNSEGGQDD